jgi:DNA-binding protein HU-beta
MTNKTDLIHDFAAMHGLTKADATVLFDSVLKFIADEAAAGERVMLKGFGTFEMRESAARPGRNPQTGEALTIPASSRLVFRAAKKAGV